MNAAEITFGVEIETHMPRGAVVRGGHGCGAQVEWLPAGWLADADPSIIPPNDNRVGCEFVSPVLKGADGLRQLCEVIAEIKRRGGQVNASCGLHVHVGFDKANTPAVRKLLNLVANHEKALYAVTGTRGREQGVGSRYRTCWCKSVKQYGNASRAEAHARHDRYHVLNLATDGKPTVEFRVFGASLNAEKAAAYVRLCVALVEKAMVAKATRFATSASATRNRGRFTGGEGHAELVRLLYSIGWRKNGASTKGVYGVIEADGVPTMDAARKQLSRLAKKYDAAPLDG
jgi:hypothetical protein